MDLQTGYSINYERMSDDELLVVVADRHNLVEEAQSALDLEISKRNLIAQELPKTVPPQLAHRPIRQIEDLKSTEIINALRANRILIFCVSLPLNIILAVFGTAWVESPLARAIGSHSVSAYIWKELILSVIFAAVLGFFAARSWMITSAKWSWVLPAVSFAIAALTFSGSGSILNPTGLWDRFSGSGCSGGMSALGCRSFFYYTVTLVRTLSYSIAAVLYGVVANCCR